MKHIVIIILLSLIGTSCQKKQTNQTHEILALILLSNQYVWDLPPGFPVPVVPEDNPMSIAKVKLGRHLFYDTKMSLNQTKSCASCHLQSLAFTDGLATAIGSTGEIHPRNSQNLGNVAYNARYTWANPTLDKLENQALGPMFGINPIELGMGDQENILFDRLASDENYRIMFKDAFGSETAISTNNIVKSIASFQRTLMSGYSPYDYYINNIDRTKMSASAIRGMNIFFGENAECFHCHGSFNFSNSVAHTGNVTEVSFHNTGLYNVDGINAYPTGNQGIFESTGDPAHKGLFKAPSLRNVELTAPYFHDGSASTLDEIVGFYMAGGRNVTSGANAGDGRANTNKDIFVRPFSLTAQEKADLIEFLKSLTDTKFINDPRFSNPF